MSITKNIFAAFLTIVFAFVVESKANIYEYHVPGYESGILRQVYFANLSDACKIAILHELDDFTDANKYQTLFQKHKDQILLQKHKQEDMEEDMESEFTLYIDSIHSKLKNLLTLAEAEPKSRSRRIKTNVNNFWRTVKSACSGEDNMFFSLWPKLRKEFSVSSMSS